MMCMTVQLLVEPSILIVEDNGPLRSALREWLATSFPRSPLFEATSGEEAVTVAGREHPDIILMDIGLPGMDGVRATREIKRRHPEARVVVLTIHEDSEYRIQAAAAGASAFVAKRTMRGDLLPVLRMLLAGTPGDAAPEPVPPPGSAR